jgi:hypothetical protein
MKHLPRLTRLEQAVQHRRTEQPPAEVDEPITLLEGLRLFEYGIMDTPAPLGIRPGDDGRLHIVITEEKYSKSTNRFALHYAAMLAQLAPAFDAEWQDSGYMRLILLTEEEAKEAAAAIDRGDLEWRTGSKGLLWWAGEGAAKRVPYVFLARIDSTARVLRDQGETVNILADLRALLTEALEQEN